MNNIDQQGHVTSVRTEIDAFFLAVDVSAVSQLADALSPEYSDLTVLPYACDHIATFRVYPVYFSATCSHDGKQGFHTVYSVPIHIRMGFFQRSRTPGSSSQYFTQFPILSSFGSGDIPQGRRRKERDAILAGGLIYFQSIFERGGCRFIDEYSFYSLQSRQYLFQMPTAVVRFQEYHIHFLQ